MDVMRVLLLNNESQPQSPGLPVSCWRLKDAAWVQKGWDVVMLCFFLQSLVPNPVL